MPIISRHAVERAVQRLGLEPRWARGKLNWLFDRARLVKRADLPGWFNLMIRKALPCERFRVARYGGHQAVLVSMVYAEGEVLVTVIIRRDDYRAAP